MGSKRSFRLRRTRISSYSSTRRLGPRVQSAEHFELLAGGRIGGPRGVRHPQLPTRRLPSLLRGGARVQSGQDQLLRLGVRAQDAEVGDHDRGTRPMVAEPLAGTSTLAVPDRGYESELFDESARLLAEH